MELAGEHPCVHADETRIPVAQPGNPHNAWIWTLVCENVVAYVFSETRAAETANMML